MFHISTNFSLSQSPLRHTIVRITLLVTILVTQFYSLALSPAPTALASAPFAACIPVWEKVGSPHLGETSWLTGVTAISATDVWAVGFYYSNFADHTLTLHNDGTGWETVLSPNPNLGSNHLHGVSGTGTNDVWAVGYTQDDLFEAYRTMTLHWNGTAWSTIASPNMGTQANELLAVKAISSNDVWAVGYYQTDSENHALAMHWDGTAWTIINPPASNLPDVPTTYLRGVSAVSTHDVWAVGFQSGSESGQPGLTFHWNGSAWSQIDGPVQDENHLNNLSSVDAIATDDIWTAGFVAPTVETLTAHWAGSAWQTVSNPAPANASNNLNAVSAIATDRVWSVGYTQDSTTLDRTPLILYWNGSAWSIQPSPSLGKTAPGAFKFAMLNDVAGISASDAWAVGYYLDKQSVGRTLTFHYQPAAGVPVKPALQTPSNNASVSSAKVLLDWQNTNCATKYDVTVHQDSKTGTVVANKTALKKSKYKTLALAAGHDYFWQVRACNASGCGKWSKFFKFSNQ